MAVVQCENKHYYDNVKFAQCPHCAKMAEGKMQRQTMIESQRAGTYASEYIRQNMLRKQTAEKTAPEKEALREIQSGAIQSEENGIKENDMQGNAMGGNGTEDGGGTDYGRKTDLYAAGWLVCTGGGEYGRNFPLYAGFNRIGRTSENDIILADEHLSKGEHCSVIYEEKKNVFYVVPKAGNLVYANDVLVEEARKIEEGTVIMAGETELELVVFCKGEKRWEKNRKG